MQELAGYDTRVLYTLLLGAIVLERLIELGITRRNRAWALERGGVEVGRDHYRWMVLVHTLFLISCPAEVWLLERPFLPGLGVPMLGLLAASMALRYWAVTTLGRRWTTRVICVPGLEVVTGGPYRFVRHPNYVAVVVELFALPLVHTAWWTAIVFSAANLLVLRTRIRVEEAALDEHNDYRASFRTARSGSP